MYKKNKRESQFEKYIGIGFIILCLTLLVSVIGILGYRLYINKEMIDISPSTNINQIH